MCIGEGSLDTLAPQEQERLRVDASAILPLHRVDLRTNDEGTRWIVLEPRATDGLALRFTICRVAPSVVVMVEASTGQRQFHSFDGVEGVVAFARSATDQSVLAAAHRAPDALQ